MKSEPRFIFVFYKLLATLMTGAVLFFLPGESLSQGYKIAKHKSPLLEKYPFSTTAFAIKPSLTTFLYVPAFNRVPQIFWYFPSTSFLYGISFSESDRSGRFSSSGYAFFGLGIGGLLNFPYEGPAIFDYENITNPKISSHGFGSNFMLFPYLVFEFISSSSFNLAFLHLFAGISAKIGYLINPTLISQQEWNSNNIFWTINLRGLYFLEIGLGVLFSKQFVFSLGINMPLGFSAMYWKNSGTLTEKEYLDLAIKSNPPKIIAALDTLSQAVFVEAGKKAALLVRISNEGIHPAVDLKAFVIVKKSHAHLFPQKEFFLGDIHKNLPEHIKIPLNIPRLFPSKTVHAKLVFKELNHFTPLPLDISFSVIPPSRFRRIKPSED